MKKYFSPILILVLFSVIYWTIGSDIIPRLSATYDEAVYLAAGYSYWRLHDFRLNNQDHPPLAKLLISLPLLFSDVYFPVTHPAWSEARQYAFADIFLYHNRLPAEVLLARSRRMILFISWLAGLLIFCWVRQLTKNFLTAFFSWLLYLFSPAILANATLATTDLVLMAFYLATIYFCWFYWQKPSAIRSIFLGIGLGLSLTAKHSGIVLWLIVGVIFIAEFFRQRKFSFTQLILMIFFSWLVIYLVYFGQEPIKNYLIGLKDLFGKVGQGRSSLFLGKYSTTGWRTYFLVAFLLKNPLPFLLLILISLFFYRQYFSATVVWYLLWPALVYFLLASFSRMQIGFRHILPVFPFIFILIGLAGQALAKKNIITRILVLILVAWCLLEPFRYHPYEISYFNQIVKNNSAWNYFTDSNLDWGQGLVALSDFLQKEGNPPIYLCYFGTADPNYYHLRYIPFGFITNVSHRPPDLSPQEKSRIRFLVISATNFMATYYAEKNVFVWLQKYPPDKVVAFSLLVYDLEKQPEIRPELLRRFAI